MNISSRASNIIKNGIRSFGSNITYDLTVGQPDFLVPSCLKEEIKHIVDNDKNGYISTGGEIYIKKLIIEKYRKKYTLFSEADEKNIVITSGVTGGLYSALLALIDIGDTVLLADPYFSPYVDMIKLAGGKVKLIDTYPDFYLTADRIEKQIDNHCKVLLINSPNNPTGRIIPLAELDKIVRLCKEHNITILSDEIYESYVYTDKYNSLGDITNEAVIFRGFSKSHGVTGWRIGFIIAPTEIAGIIERIQGKIYVSAPSITHYTIPTAITYDNSGFCRLLAERRNAVLSILRDVCPDIFCDGGFFVFINIENSCGMTGTEFVSVLRTVGVAILPGIIFSARDTHCRLSLTCNTEKLISASNIIKKCIIACRKKRELK